MFTQICLWLIIVGALNWGFIGIFNFNLVSFIFGDMTVLSRITYILVGLSALCVALDVIQKYYS